MVTADVARMRRRAAMLKTRLTATYARGRRGEGALAALGAAPMNTRHPSAR
jgi:hypothetical protein